MCNRTQVGNHAHAVQWLDPESKIPPPCDELKVLYFAFEPFAGDAFGLEQDYFIVHHYLVFMIDSTYKQLQLTALQSVVRRLPAARIRPD